MKRVGALSGLFLALCLGWCGTMLVTGAGAGDETPVLQPEQDTPPASLPPTKPAPKKHVRHRPAREPFGNDLAQNGNDIVQIGKDVVIKSGETVRSLVVIAGDATIDGTVEGNLVIVSGSATINGQVGRNLITILGAATLGPQGQVGRDAVVIGGPLAKEAKSTIDGRETVVSLNEVMPNFTWLQRWLVKGLFLARPFPPELKWVWAIAAVFLLVYVGLTAMFPRPVRVCIDRLERQPVASFFLGIFLILLIAPISVLLAVSVVGLLAIPFVACALFGASLFGSITVYSYAGQQVGRQMHLPDLGMPVLLVLGTVLFYVIYMVPVLGFAVWGLVTVVGLGAVLLAALGSMRRERQPALVPAVGLSGVGTAVLTAPAVSDPSLPPVLAPVDVVMLPRVGFWRRLAATLLDFILLGMLIPITGPLFLLVWAAYYVAMWTWKGTTVGGIVLNIKVVRADGQPINFAVALIRCLSSFFSAFALFLGFFWAGWDRERQAWHDKIAGTVVVKVPRGLSLI